MFKISSRQIVCLVLITFVCQMSFGRSTDESPTILQLDLSAFEGVSAGRGHPIFEFDPTTAKYASSRDLPAYVDINANVARGGRPTAKGIEQLSRKGFRTILNIENNIEAINRERLWVESAGMNYISIPLGWDRAPADEEIDEILRLLKDPNNFPIFLHCKHGEDRTGMVMGIYRVLVDGWSRQAAYEEMLELGFHKIFKALEDYFWRKTER